MFTQQYIDGLSKGKTRLQLYPDHIDYTYEKGDRMFYELKFGIGDYQNMYIEIKDPPSLIECLDKNEEIINNPKWREYQNHRFFVLK